MACDDGWLAGGDVCGAVWGVGTVDCGELSFYPFEFIDGKRKHDTKFYPCFAVDIGWNLQSTYGRRARDSAIYTRWTY